MKWYSVNKFIPPASYHDYVLVCVLDSTGCRRLKISHYEDNVWTEVDDREPIESDRYKVTHFMMIDPIEIDP